MKSKHLILYDDSCSLCRKAVYQLIQKDPKALFAYAPLWGDTAKAVLKDQYQKIFESKTMVLIENFLSEHPKVYLYSRAIFRIYWLFGGINRAIGCLSFLFPFTNILYQLVAKHRHKVRLDEEKSPLEDYKDRFLS